MASIIVVPHFPFASLRGDDIDPFVRELQQYLIDIGLPNALEEAVQTALKWKIPQQVEWGITSADRYLEFANMMLKWIPHENFQGKDIYWMLCMFYFILDQMPLLPLQTEVLPSSIGKPLTWVSDWIVRYARKMGTFMDTPESITTASYESFVNSPKYNIHEAIVPPGGFKTFNELFARHLKKGMRPIDAPTDPKTIVFPADSSFDGAWQIEDDSIVTIKNLPWPIKDLLHESKYRDKFGGGIWMHAFLNTFDYHRQHAPVAGKILEARVIEGAAYLEVIVTQDSNGKPTLEPIRGGLRKHYYGAIPISGGNKLDGSEVDAPNTPGYQFLQIRGLITIDSPVLGLVAVLPIGMAQVSSVKISPEIYVGKSVKKGDEISYFQFGGSDVVLVFQKKAGLTVDSFPTVPTPPAPPIHYNMGNTLAVAP